jgi:hypothetical protein
MTLVFAPNPLPADRMSYVDDVPGIERRLTLLSFTEVAPEECWSACSSTGDAVAADGQGRVELAAPFYPTVPGTDLHVDELR